MSAAGNPRPSGREDANGTVLLWTAAEPTLRGLAACPYAQAPES